MSDPQPPNPTPAPQTPPPTEPAPDNESGRIEAVESATIRQAQASERRRLPLEPSAAPLEAPKPVGADPEAKRAKATAALPTLKDLRDRLRHDDDGGGGRVLPKSLLQMETMLALGTALIAAIVYGTTLAPDVTFGNSGELVTVLLSDGNAHPTGYPTFILLTGWLSGLIRAFTNTDIAAINFATAALTALSAFFLHRWLSFTQLKLRPDLGPLAPDDPEVATRLDSLRARRDRVLFAAAATAGALYLAFGRFIWARANSVEVYGVQVCLLAALLYLFCRACYYDDYQKFNATAEPSPGADRADRKRRRRLWWVFSLLLGLAFGSHLTTLLLLPAMLYLYLVTQGVGARSLRRLAVNSLFVGLGSMVYLTLLGRAGGDPVINWGNPSTPAALWRHIRGWTGYPIQDLRDPGSLAGLLDGLVPSFTLIVLGLALLGLWRAWQLKPTLAIFTGAVLATALGYLAVWPLPDQRAAGLLVALMIAFWAGLGVNLLLSFLIRQSKPVRYAAAAVPVLYGAALGWLNHEELDRSSNRMVREYTLNVLAQADSQAVVLTSQWDSFGSAALYYQNIGYVRPDVTLVETELLRRPWYLDQLGTTQPSLVDRIAPELATLRGAAEAAELDRGRALPEDDPLVVAALRAAIDRTLRLNRPVYVTGELPTALPTVVSGYTLVPEGVIYRVQTDTVYRPIRQMELRTEEVRVYRWFRGDEVALARLYLELLAERGDGLLRAGRPQQARDFYTRALAIPGGPALDSLRRVASPGQLRQMTAIDSLRRVASQGRDEAQAALSRGNPLTPAPAP